MAMIIEPVSPTQQDIQMAAEAYHRLAKYTQENVQIQIGAEGRQEYLALPPIVARLLSYILDETASGHAVSIVPADSDMTTSEAADYLNVSRPYLTSLLEQGKIPFHRVGSHRRVRAVDMADYKKRRMAASHAAMAELQAQAEELNMEG